ncbi:VOC family protein [Pseudomonas gingeri]|uniref:VOC family protein n=1 Tax=Pseudomonas gingeri TaxID=117681 RepID=A0A7Y7XC55_9PSED|nr:VOC family protein [Pseudomonas gingeri]NWA29043.1 VOC family protein [Pseudomonas gingeri]NWB97145.1 VOC family protein [Pseudomonas gingeri]NWD73517.1 VOC family protein [Pseudomonas gingeri]
MHLDHANIVTPDLDRTVRFFTDVLGFTTGPRPDFRVPGYWLYSAGRPVIHLTQATLTLPAGKMSPRIDHIAVRVADLDEWTALLGRLKSHNIEYQLNARNDGNDTQLWVALAAGVTIEIIVANETL